MKTFVGWKAWPRTGPNTWTAWVVVVLLGVLQGCSTPAPPSPPPLPPAPPAPAALPSLPTPVPEVARPPEPQNAHTSRARTPRDYRRDAAQHLYQREGHRIYKGRLPPMLYAVGVLNVDIDRAGQVQALNWMRAPRHAPEVMAEIEKMVRAAAPYPSPQHLGQVTYTDVWLWHRSGRFQLDTLTEGQD